MAKKTVNFDELIILIDAATYRHFQKHLRDIDVLVLKESLNHKSYDQIAYEHNYTGQYLRQDVGPKLWKTLSQALNFKVTKKNCRSVLEPFWKSNKDLQTQSPTGKMPTLADIHLVTEEHPFQQRSNLENSNARVDWGDLMDAPIFYGRKAELALLQERMSETSCRVVVLLGMGGIGKTTLALKLTAQVQSQFQFVMVRSVRNAPTLTHLLNQFFNHVGIESDPSSLKEQDAIQHFIAILQRFRCLIVFDNVETLLRSKQNAGQFIEGYEGYGELLQQVADQSHQSCVLITSRELPRGLGHRAGQIDPVQILKLSGLSLTDAKAILQHKGIREIDIPSLEEVLQHYGGNPLALKIVAVSVIDMGEGNLKNLVPFLQRGILQFEDINDLLGRQFQRLDAIERQIMYWLMLHRDPLTLMELEQNILRFNVLRQLPKAVQSLTRKSLLERQGPVLFLQPVVLDYVTQRFLESLAEEVMQSQYVLLQNYALLQAQAKDYIRQAQQQFILEPLLSQLRDYLGSNQAISDHLLLLLDQLRLETRWQPSYACGNLLNLLRIVRGTLNDLDCSGLSVWQAYLVGTPLHRLNFQQADLSRSVFNSVLSTTLSVAFSSDGHYFAMGNADNTVRVWSVQDSKELMICQGHQNWASTVTFCCHKQLLLSGSFDKTIKLWDLETGQCLNTLTGHTGWIWAVVCSPDGRHIASGSDDHTIRIWDRVTGTCLQVLEGAGAAVLGLAYSPDGQFLASASANTAAPVKIWAIDTGEVRSLIPASLNRRIRAIAYSPDGHWLATGSLSCITEVWNLDSGECVHQLQGHSQPVTTLAFSPETAKNEQDRGPLLLATGSQDSTLRLWNARSGESLHILKGHPNGIWSLAFHPRESLLISGSNDSTVKIWNTQTGESIRTIQGYSIGIKAIALSPDQRLLASAGDDTLIHLWNRQTHHQIKTLSGHSSWIWALAFTSDGRFLVSGGNDNSLRLWDVETGEVVRQYQGHRSLIFSLDINADSSFVASASDDHTVRIWDLKTTHCQHLLQHQGRVWSVAISPQGNALAAGNCETLISLWDLNHLDAPAILEGHSSLVWAIAYSPDGALIASGSDDMTAKIWSVSSHQCLQTLTGHDGSIWAIAFSPDGKWIATGSNDRRIHVWEVESGALVKTLYGHESAIWDLVFQDSEYLISASQEGTLKVWNLISGICEDTIQDIRPYEGMNLVGATGLTEAQKISLTTLGAIV